MALFLVQHGMSNTKETDPEKGLSELGIEKSLTMASVAKGYHIPVARVFHSGKKRAEQTARIFHRALGLDSPVTRLSGINPLDDVRAFAASLDPKANWMVVGHLPFMDRLVFFLTAGDETLRVYQFQNSGIVCLDAADQREDDWDWSIKWTLNPNIT
ncbi:MAG: phosphohistidine phosphatase SixA [Desulfobacter sp.]|nr:phosphohistidine phosphatase SixA [Desulfobacter sp.]